MKNYLGVLIIFAWGSGMEISWKDGCSFPHPRDRYIQHTHTRGPLTYMHASIRHIIVIPVSHYYHPASDIDKKGIKENRGNSSGRRNESYIERGKKGMEKLAFSLLVSFFFKEYLIPSS